MYCNRSSILEPCILVLCSPTLISCVHLHGKLNLIDCPPQRIKFITSNNQLVNNIKMADFLK